METLSEIEREYEEFRNNHSIKYIFRQIYYDFRRLILKFNPMEVMRQIKWMIQRIDRGYSDRDVWGFDFYLAKVISSGLRDLKANTNGIPYSFCKHQEDSNCKKGDADWQTVLNIIIWAFETHMKISSGELWYFPLDTYKEKEYTDLLNRFDLHDTEVLNPFGVAKYEEGLKLFGKYLGNYWS